VVSNSKKPKKKITLSPEPKARKLEDFLNGATKSEFDVPLETVKPETEEIFTVNEETPQVQAVTKQLEEGNVVYPWEESTVRPDLMISCSRTTLPEPYVLKLRFIAENSSYSQQRIIRDAVMMRVDELMAELKDQGILKH
jgi:hypothetical protein